jgi:hypothetical protein
MTRHKLVENCRSIGQRPKKIVLFSPFQACSSSILMPDPLESALRNCNAALQNSSTQALFGRSYKEP